MPTFNPYLFKSSSLTGDPTFWAGDSSATPSCFRVDTAHPINPDSAKYYGEVRIRTVQQRSVEPGIERALTGSLSNGIMEQWRCQ